MVENRSQITKIYYRISKGSEVDPKHKVVDFKGGKCAKVTLDGKAQYRVRVRACNKVGCFGWSRWSFFEAPGVPGAPFDLKMTSNAEGVAISWSPPPEIENAGKTEYRVCLAVNPATGLIPSLISNHTFV